MITDYLGSVRGVVNTSTGEIVQRRDYDAWGVATVDTNAAFQALGYAGGLADSSTGLVRFGARDYLPSAGVWTVAEPHHAGLDIGGQYAYLSGAAPTTHVDPTGLLPAQPNDDNGWEELARILYCNSLHGLEAFLDGVIPWSDPLAALGAYNPSENGLKYSQTAGAWTRDAELALLALYKAGVRDVIWKGTEIVFRDKDGRAIFRLAPFGHGAAEGQENPWYRRLPHYHRRGGGPVEEHRPWEKGRP